MSHEEACDVDIVGKSIDCVHGVVIASYNVHEKSFVVKLVLLGL